MSVRLVAANDHPRSSVLDERHEAEWLQVLLNDEQAEANTIAAFVGEHIVTLVAGLLIGAAIALLMVMEFSR